MPEQEPSARWIPQVTPRGWRILFLLLVFAAVMALGYRLRAILNPLLLSALIAYILNPVVELLERRGLSRAKATALIFILFFIALLGLLAALAPVAIRQAENVSRYARKAKRWAEERYENLPDPAGELDQLDEALDTFGFSKFAAPPEDGRPPAPEDAAEGRPLSSYPLDDLRACLGMDPSEQPKRRAWAKDALDRIQAMLEKQAEQEEARGGEEVQAAMLELRSATLQRMWLEDVLVRLEQWVSENAGMIAKRAASVLSSTQEGILSGIRGIFAIVSYGLLVPVYTYFLMIALPKIVAAFRDHLPGRYRERVLGVVTKVDMANSAFFRGKLLICLVKGTITFLGLWICGIPFSLLLGILAAFASLVPFAPIVLAFLPALVLSYMDFGWGRVIHVCVVFLAAEGAEFALTPLWLGRQVALHPITILISLFVGGELLGLFGVLLSVPLACIVKILFLDFVVPEIKALAREGPDAGAQPATAQDGKK